MKKYSHDKIQKTLSLLEDGIFQNLPNDIAKSWSSRFSEAAIGADLSRVWPKFAIFLLTDKSQCNSKHPQCDIVADAFRRELNGDIVDWKKVKDDAMDVSTIAAYAESVGNISTDAADAAITAAYASAAAYGADPYAAPDAAGYAAAAAINRKSWVLQSEKLLEILKEEEMTILNQYNFKVKEAI